MPEMNLQTQPTHTATQRAAIGFVRAVEKFHAVLGAVVLVGALALTYAQAPGTGGLGTRGHWTAVLAGLLLGGANFRVLGWLTAKMLLSDEPSSRNGAVLVLVLKLGVLALLLLGVFRVLQPDGVTLLLALSLAPFCLVVEALRRGGRLGLSAGIS